MRKHYKARLQALLDILSQPELAGLCEAKQAVAGLHFLLAFHTKERGAFLSAKLQAAGLPAPLLSEFYLREAPMNAGRCAVVQYAGLDPDAFAQSMQNLAKNVTPEIAD